MGKEVRPKRKWTRCARQQVDKIGIPGPAGTIQGDKVCWDALCIDELQDTGKKRKG